MVRTSVICTASRLLVHRDSQAPRTYTPAYQPAQTYAASVRGVSVTVPIIVEVEADDGSVGIGLTQSPAAVIRPIIEHGPGALRNHLLGEDPRDVDRLW